VPVVRLVYATLLLVAVALAVPAPTRAVPGPDSVAVLANANVPESVALARMYAVARQVPATQVCAVDVPADVTIPLATFESSVRAGLESCLASAGALDRIEAVVVVRGMPLRVAIPTGNGDRRVSIAAALGLWRSTTDGDVPVLGQEPGQVADCGGTPCYAARWSNPFRSGTFEAGFSRDLPRLSWRPLLVTMLHGRTYEDAARLVTSAVAAEETGAARGEFLFMEAADSARGRLDAEITAVMAALTDRGVAEVARTPFDPDLTGRTLGAFFTGTAGIGTTIEGNTWAPGSLVDNLTSLGAVPQNFEATGESQVSIARWVAMGVGGAHGTTDEPLNNVFPSRWLIVDYVDGSTLAEAYHRRLPNVYWQNLVLGDPMLAPYAVRPEVVIEGVVPGEEVAGARRVVVTATDPEGMGIASLVLLVNGVEIARVDGDRIEACVSVPVADDVQLLAVAQKLDDGTERGLQRPKGWAEVRVKGLAGPATCPDATDGGLGDGGSDTDASVPDAGPTGGGGGDGGGCGCMTAEGGARGMPAVVLLALAWVRCLRGRGRRRRPPIRR